MFSHIFVVCVLCVLCIAAPSHYFLQISDQHLEWEYHEGTDPSKDYCRSNVPGSAGRFGDYGCHSPEALISAHFEECKARFPEPDFILWTGDARRGFATVDGDREVLWVLKNMTAQMKMAYPSTQVFPVLGNHDVHPDNLHGPKRSDLYKQMVPLWTSWLDSGAQKTFGHGGYYFRRFDDYSVIVLNTCMYITFDTDTKDLDDPAGQLQWLEDVLTSFPDMKFYVAGHCPIDYSMYPKPVSKLLSIIRKHHSQIEAIFMGHCHIDATTLIFDEEGTNPLLIQYLSPSIATRPGGLHGGHNPAYRVYYRHVENGVAQMNLDKFETYYLRLAEANKKLKAEFEFSYGSCDGRYPGLDIKPPITAEKWYESVMRCEKNTTLMRELYNRYNVYSLESGDKCVDSCAKDMLCTHLYYADKNQFDKCKA